ncbi:MAG: hypothetical protein J6B26_08940 [Agathobacter sp.]|nr:hypothetical protein [Agathobacter sp.]MBQ2283135.1 hypothetical protein [Agathobacter sp.]
MNKKRKFSVNIGFSSIMMVFIMICLVTFATLSLLTSHSDYRLSQKMADKTTAYYEADTIAKDTARMIEQYLDSLYENSTDAASYYHGINADLIRGELPDQVYGLMVSDTEIPVISYQVTISSVQTLYVSLEVHYPQNGEESFYKITRWQSKTSNAPAEEDHLNLFGG